VSHLPPLGDQPSPLRLITTREIFRGSSPSVVTHTKHSLFPCCNLAASPCSCVPYAESGVNNADYPPGNCFIDRIVPFKEESTGKMAKEGETGSSWLPFLSPRTNCGTDLRVILSEGWWRLVK